MLPKLDFLFKGRVGYLCRLKVTELDRVRASRVPMLQSGKD